MKELSRNSFKGDRAFQVELELGNVGFLEGGKSEYPEKNPRSRGENPQQTQPTYDVNSGNETQATVVEGDSHHCAIPAPPLGELIWEASTPYTIKYHCFAKMMNTQFTYIKQKIVPVTF